MSPRLRLFARALEHRLLPAIFTVTNSNDSGIGSLRTAITSVNTDTLLDEIRFDNTFFSTPRTINLSSPLPIVTSQVNFVGPGSDKVTIQRAAGAGNFRILRTENTATISGLTLSNGNMFGTSQGGGGLYATSPNSITLDGLVVRDCISSSVGGGISIGVCKQFVMRDCTVSGNTANGTDFFSGRGGGLNISSGFSNESVRIDRCTFSYNQANHDGGRIF